MNRYKKMYGWMDGRIEEWIDGYMTRWVGG